MAETYWEGADRKKKNMRCFMVFTFLRYRSVHNNRSELSFVNLKLSKKAYRHEDCFFSRRIASENSTAMSKF